jgi:hypothetical protein
MIYEFILKSGNILFVESNESLASLRMLKDCLNGKRAWMLEEVELLNNEIVKKGYIVIDVFSIETIREIKIKNGEMN